MAKVKIQGHASGTGILTVTAPNTSTDRTITLPDATGTLLNSDGSAASLTAIPAANITGTLPAISGASLTALNATNLGSGTVPTARLGSGTASSSTILYGDQTYKTAPSGLYSSVAIIGDVKSAGTAGGSSSATTHNIRDLNTEISDVDGIVSISSNRFTLAAGTYTIHFATCAFATDGTVARLRDYTNSAYVGEGMSESFTGNNNVGGHVTGSTVVTPSGSTAYELHMYTQTAQSANGLGSQGAGEGGGAGSDIYTLITILKHA